MKKALIICLYIVLIALNLTPVIVFYSEIRFSQYSIPALILMLLTITNGIMSFIFRHKGNFLYFRKFHPNIFSSDKKYTFTAKYTKKFYTMLCIYFAVIPFYIPLILFVSNWSQTLWTLFVFFFPQVIFIIQDIVDTINDYKKYKSQILQEADELKKQQQREELGRWK